MIVLLLFLEIVSVKKNKSMGIDSESYRVIVAAIAKHFPINRVELLSVVTP